MQTIVSQESVLEFNLVYKNVCLNILRQKLQKLETANFDEILSNLHFLSISLTWITIFEKKFRSIICPQIS